jgi:hypothetical protein
MRTLGPYNNTCVDDAGNEHVVKTGVAQCADFDIYDGVVQLMELDTTAYDDMVEFNRKWANGTAAGQPDVIDDFDGGLNFLEHEAFKDGIPEGVWRAPIAVEADEADVPHCPCAHARRPPLLTLSACGALCNRTAMVSVLQQASSRFATSSSSFCL